MCDYLSHVRRTMDGIHFFSTGALPGCSECNLDEDATDEARQLMEEPSFSWSQCERCCSTFGGDRYLAHGYFKDAEGREHLLHYDICYDCVMHDAYGDEPEDWCSSPHARRTCVLTSLST
jgi:hypothetical protein